MPSRRRRYRSRPKPQLKKLKVNLEITASEVRLVSEDGTQLGVVPRSEALAKAGDANLDLVIVAEKTDPPVARIMDLGKYTYERRKKDAKQKVKSKDKEVKGIRIGLKTDEHDWNVRIKHATKFLEAGHKIKVEVRLRGRERQRVDLARLKLEKFIAEVPMKVRQQDMSRSPYGGLSITLLPE